jgi:hypothetical protein
MVCSPLRPPGDTGADDDIAAIFGAGATIGGKIVNGIF